MGNELNTPITTKKSFDFEKQTAEIYIECSKGTYIRSIANDLGNNLGCGGYLYRLIRTQAGKFYVEKSINLYDFKTIEAIRANLINPLEMINLPVVEINETEHKKVLHGQFLENKTNSCHDFVLLIYNNDVSAVAIQQDGLIKVKKVFS